MKPSLLLGKTTHEDLSQLLRATGRLIISGAANETAKAMIFTHLSNFHAQPTVIVTDDDHIEAWEHWLHFFEATTECIHPSDEDDGLSVVDLQKFLLVMQSKCDVCIIPRSVWDRDMPCYEELYGKILTLTSGEEYGFTGLIEKLLENGYAHTDDTHLEPGEYRKHGDVLEVFPVQSHISYRVSFAMDTVESITTIHTEDRLQKGEVVSEISLFPLEYDTVQPFKDQIPEEVLTVLDDQDDTEDSDGPTLRFTSFPESQEHHVHLRYLSVLKFYTLTDFLNDVRDKLHQKWTLLVVTKRAKELAGIFSEEHIPHATSESQRDGAITIVSEEEGALLPHSIQNPDLQCALLTDREIFSLRKAGKQRSVQKLALDFLTSLTSGDYVVHMEHGIGRFEGVTQKDVDGTIREYLELSYAEGDKLFVPVDQADKLSKFVHEEGQDPVLTRLGTSEWKKVTDRIKRETEEVAKELLGLYAKRASAKGFAYGEHEKAVEKFENAFPYELTPGQRQAIDDISKDMEDDHPMDRLVCGDVGFGKTEVAMRAAFKAVQDGKQVAVVAPITILADQHYHNFCKRFTGFPTRVEMLSRFRTPKQQKEVLEKLRKGDIDIVIGTHRLMQKDVEFFNLGLVIVDEEQRFGVKQKERFKELRASVDILTLTATPIPRTLNLGLHKLRDITTITTPPPGRLPIITEVRKYSDELVRHAILTELKRKGQSFMLHNKVETIDAFADKLRKLIPEATFVVAHGQLKPEDLEKRIVAFKEGTYDVLVSSTIIENGIDLPRANTLIVNEAERFGLAQLYQLRGRVGRGKVQAHAYLLYHSQKLPEDAKKRLRAIVEACELGSGFQVAMRDLEIRGAGEILGVSQAGTMHTVGISHYLRMLKNAMEELKAGKKDVFAEEENVEILLPIEALIPSFYIPDSEERISVYQKLAGSESEEILKEFEVDLRDEFGELPKQVQRLFALLRLKLACRKSGVVRIKSEASGKEQDIILTLSPRVTAKEIMQLVAKHSQWRISGSMLRISEEKLISEAKDGDWIAVLTAHVALLRREKEKTPKKKEV